MATLVKRNKLRNQSPDLRVPRIRLHGIVDSGFPAQCCDCLIFRGFDLFKENAGMLAAENLEIPVPPSYFRKSKVTAYDRFRADDSSGNQVVGQVVRGKKHDSPKKKRMGPVSRPQGSIRSLRQRLVNRLSGSPF